MKSAKAIVFMMVLVLLLAGSVNAFQYEISYYMKGGTGTIIETADVPFLAINGDTNLNLNMRSSFNTSSSYTYTGLFKSPYLTTILTNSGNGNSNLSCRNLGTAYKEYNEGDGIIETEVSNINDADTSTIYSKSSYQVITNDRNLDIFSFGNVDSEGFVPNIYYQRVCEADTGVPSENDIYSKFTQAMFTECGNMIPTRTPATIGFSACGGDVNKRYEYVVINSTTGNVTYSLISGGILSRFVVYPLDSPVGVATLCASSISCSGSKVLDANKLYVFGFGTTGYSTSQPVGHFNITVDLGIPAYTCGDWSDCEEGYYSRTCIDENGLQPPKLITQSCSLIVLENATLGFEEYYNDFALKCIPDWLGAYQIQNITRDTPVGWSVAEDFTNEGIQRDFLRMTSIWKSEGARSLMMWYIPPKNGEPLTNTTCGNITYGTTPLIYQGVSNTTFSVSYNVTFPAENMMLSFDVKGCPEQVLQHDPLYTLWIFQVAPKVCYAGDCNTTPDSAYQFFIRNSAGEILTNYYDNYVNPFRKDTPQIDLTGLGLIVGETYTLNFQAMPENLNSQAGNCVMFDNVKYNVLQDPYLDIIGGDCSIGSKCIGTALYVTHQYEGGKCVVVKTEDACGLPDDILDKIAKLEDYCDLEDSNILNSYDFEIQDWRDVTCEYGCEDDRCLTAEDIEEAELSISLYAPHPVIQDILDSFDLGLEDYGVIWFFLSIFMFINYIAIGLGLGIATAVRSESKDSKDFYIPFIVIVLIVLISSTFAGYYPLEVGIPLIIGIGLMLWKTSERIISGGG